MKKIKPIILCDECNKNIAQVNSYSVLDRFRKLCTDCYSKLLNQQSHSDLNNAKDFSSMP